MVEENEKLGDTFRPNLNVQIWKLITIDLFLGSI